MLFKIKLNQQTTFIAGNLLAYNSIFNIWSIEHYTKCSFRCIYCCCDSQGKSIPTISTDNIISSLNTDIENAEKTGLFFRHKTRVIISCHTDPYVDIEKEFLLTRIIISHLIEIEQPFSIVTRGVLIQRDFDLLEANKINCDVSFSLPIINPDYLEKYEPNVPPIEQRIDTIFSARDRDLNIVVRIDPWIPGVTDVAAIIKKLPKNINILVSPLMLSDVFKKNLLPDEMGINKSSDMTADKNLLLEKYTHFSNNGFCQTATKFFKNLSQEQINQAYINERNKLGFRPKVRWFYPPIHEKNINDIAFRFLKPNEIPST